MTTNYIVKFKVLEDDKKFGAWYTLLPCKNKKEAELLKNQTTRDAEKYNCLIKCVIQTETKTQYDKDGYQKGLSAGDKRVIDG
jgi:hypothetical protein